MRVAFTVRSLSWFSFCYSVSLLFFFCCFILLLRHFVVLVHVMFFFVFFFLFFFSSRRRHTRCLSDWSSDVCSSDLKTPAQLLEDVGLLNDRLTAAHCIHMDDADLQRCGRAKINVAHVPKGDRKSVV